jgi:hypothetical protein
MTLGDVACILYEMLVDAWYTRFLGAWSEKKMVQWRYGIGDSRKGEINVSRGILKRKTEPLR